MNILAMDTTTTKANVSLLFNNYIFNNSIDNEITHSEKFLPLIDTTLKEANALLKDIDLFAITTGPGSFTGIRIGMASVLAFAKANNKKIFALTSLEVIAYTKIDKNIKNQYIISTMDAKNYRIYYTIYKVNYINNTPKLSNVISYYNDDINIANQNINEYFSTVTNANITITGNISKDYLDKINIKNKKSTFENATLSSATIIQICNNENFTLNDFNSSDYLYDYLTLDANYLRACQAERNKHGKFQ